MQTILDHSTEFYLMDSAPYFFAEVKRICDPKYIPNQDDVLRARAKTTGITETRFHMGQLSIQYVDVHQQLSYNAFTSHFSACSTSVGNDQRGGNGYIALNLSRRLSSVWRSANTIKCF